MTWQIWGKYMTLSVAMLVTDGRAAYIFLEIFVCLSEEAEVA